MNIDAGLALPGVPLSLFSPFICVLVKNPGYINLVVVICLGLVYMTAATELV